MISDRTHDVDNEEIEENEQMLEEDESTLLYCVEYNIFLPFYMEPLYIVFL